MFTLMLNKTLFMLTSNLSLMNFTEKPIKIGVISGKGGTGKSTVAYSLTVALSKKGFKVGIVDVDLTGPNLTDLFGRKELKVDDDEDMFIPAVNNNVEWISLGQIASEKDPVLWKGEDLASAAEQLFKRTKWSNLDFIIFDFPPGSGVEVQRMLPMMDYVLIVSIPSVLARSNVERIIEACREFQVKILGVIMNMKDFQCPTCGSKYQIFPDDHSFENLGIPTIAEIPLNPEIAKNKLINDFPVEKVLEAMKNPILLKKKKKTLKKLLLKFLLGRW